MILTVSPHPHLQTLPQAAVLAPVAVALVDGAVARAAARVASLLADAALEEALAALAGPDPVVLTGGVVTADGALQGSVSSGGSADSGGTGN